MKKSYSFRIFQESPVCESTFLRVETNRRHWKFINVMVQIPLMIEYWLIHLQLIKHQQQRRESALKLSISTPRSVPPTTEDIWSICSKIDIIQLIYFTSILPHRVTSHWQEPTTMKMVSWYMPILPPFSSKHYAIDHGACFELRFFLLPILFIEYSVR